MNEAGRWERAGRTKLDAALAGVAILLGAVTLAVVQQPARATVGSSIAGQMVIVTSMTAASALLAVLLWLRFRELRAVFLPYQAAAFATLAVVNGYFLVVATTGSGDPFAADATPATIIAYSLARVTFGILLVAGGITALRGGRTRGNGPWWLYLTAPVLVAGLVVAGMAAADVWRSATGPSLAFAASRTIEAALLVHLPIALVFLFGALVYRRLYAEEREAASAAMSLGLLVATFAQIHAAIEPGTHSARMTSEEILRLVMYGVILAGIAVQTGADVRRIVRADRDLERMRQIEMEREALEDRERLAREIHDGIAQDLWLTKLAFGQLRAKLPDDPGLERLADDVDTALQTAVATTRHAISWMQSAAISPSAFGDALVRIAEDFTNRFGLQVQVVADEAPSLEPSVQVELLRITQEALRNTLKHANTSRATVTLSVTDRWMELVIADEGRGFDMDHVPIGSFGLMTVSRRAEVIGARLDVTSRPGAGTRVSVRLARHPRGVTVERATAADDEVARATASAGIRADAGNLAGS